MTATQAPTPGPLLKGDIVRGPNGQIETVKSANPDFVVLVSGNGYLPSLVTFIGRPQPNGETRFGDETAEQIVKRWAAWINDDSEDMEEPEWGGKTRNDVLNERDFLIRCLSASPLALGGQQGEFNVEEYVADYEFRADGEGGCYTPTENERALLIDAIHGALSELSISTTPARAEAQDEEPDIKPYTEDLKGLKTAMQAEAQDEGAAGYSVALLASYCGDDTSRCTDETPCLDCVKMANVYKIPKTALGEFVGELGSIAAPSPTPAADADRVRIAVEALEPFARLQLPKRSVGNAGAYSILHADIRRATEALAALKSTAAKEGGE